MTYEEAITTLRKALACGEAVSADCIGRKSCEECEHYYSVRKCKESLAMAIDALEKVKKSEETFEWCTDCKEYDQEKHCCHRFTKTIHYTLEEVKDAYSIIFCEECIHYQRWESPSGETIDWYCDRPNQQSCQLKPTDFCSYGVRKED